VKRQTEMTRESALATERGVKPPEAPKNVPRKEVRKDHNAGGKSHWMDGFWNQPSPALWQVIDK
jgi:hypothetical protein